MLFSDANSDYTPPTLVVGMKPIHAPCHRHDVTTISGDTFTTVTYLDSEVVEVVQGMSGHDYHGYPISILVTITPIGSAAEVKINTNGQEQSSLIKDGAALLKSIAPGQAADVWKKASEKLGLKDKLGEAYGPYSWVVDAMASGGSVEDAAKVLAVAALTAACKGATVASGNPVLVAGGALGCAYLSGLLVNAAWPLVKKSAEWLANTVPGLKKSWKVVTDAWDAGKALTKGDFETALKKGFAAVKGAISAPVDTFVDLVTF